MLENNHSILPSVKALYGYRILYTILLSKCTKKQKQKNVENPKH